MHTAESLAPAPHPCRVQITIVKLKRYKSPGSDQIPAQLIQEGDETLRPESHKLINYIWNKEELPQRWSNAIIVSIYKKVDQTDCNNYRDTSLFTSYKILFNILLSKLSSYVDESIGDHQCGFRHNRATTDQIFAFVRCWKKWEYNEIVHQLLIDFEKAYNSVRRDVSYNILIEFGVTMKLASLIKTCLN
jgi:hypothetical protein